MTNLKKLSMVLLAIAGMTIMTACGSSKSVSLVNEATDAKSGEESDDYGKVLKQYSYQNETFFESEEAGTTSCKEDYELYLYDDQKAKLVKEYDYEEDNYVMTTKYKGQYKEAGNSIKFSYGDGFDNDIFILKEDGSTEYVINACDMDWDKDLSGEYTCDKSEYGKLDMTVGAFGEVTINSEKDGTLFGCISLYEGNYEVSANNKNSDGTIYGNIVFEGNTFKFVDADATFGDPTSGEYKLFGEIGEFMLDVSDDGTAKAVVDIDGEKVSFSGSCEEDTDTKLLSQVYLYGDDGYYELDLDLRQFDGNTYNYSGTMKKPLNAG